MELVYNDFICRSGRRGIIPSTKLCTQWTPCWEDNKSTRPMDRALKQLSIDIRINEIRQISTANSFKVNWIKCNCVLNFFQNARNCKEVNWHSNSIESTSSAWWGQLRSKPTVGRLTLHRRWNKRRFVSGSLTSNSFAVKLHVSVNSLLTDGK